MTAARTRLVIAGGGLAGGLAALALADRPDVDLLLIEGEERFAGNHVWSLFDSDVSGPERGLIAPLALRHWPDHEIRFPRRRRRLALGYISLASTRLDATLRDRLKPGQYRLGTPVTHVATDHVIAGGERFAADAVIDARGARSAPGLELGWQKFVGRTYRFARPHGVERPVIMDATVPQRDGYRFHYRLPFSPTELMIEDTYYSDRPSLDVAALGRGLDEAAAAFGAGECVAEETGSLPILLGGDHDALWPDDGVPRLGMAGGFFHPTTGYSLPDALANAGLLAAQRNFGTASLYGLLRGRAERLWQERRFFTLLNRMLFRAADPGQRYRVLEHFYRLGEDRIARFYGARLTALDKLRILSGRPPVPVRRALHAMRSKAA